MNEPFKPDDLLKKRMGMSKDKTERNVSVKTLDDIKLLIDGLSKHAIEDNALKLSQTINYVEDGKSKSELVEVENRDLNIRKLLIEGLDLVRKRIDIVDKMKKQYEEVDDDDDLLPEKIKWGLFDINSQYFNVDSLIKREFDGCRSGTRIRWEISEGVFEFDPFSWKLYEVTDD